MEPRVLGLLLIAFMLGGCRSPIQRVAAPPAYDGDRVAFCDSISASARTIAKRHGIQHELLMGLIRVESHFNPSAISRAGAVGLTQVMPNTAAGNQCGNLKDPIENMDCGSRVLAKFLRKYDGNLLYGLSAYNGGYRIANKANKHAKLPRNERYVEKILMAKGRFIRGGCALLIKEF